MQKKTAYLFGMNRTRVFAFLLASLCTFLFCYTASAQTLLTTLNSYNNSYPEEKVHVHFDKPFYSPGETIWFKAYLMAQGFPSLISTNFHAELIDNKGMVISKKVYPVYEATAAGNFELPAATKESGFVFRAYTTWMLNFDTAFLFTKPITLTNPSPVKAVAAKAATQLRFFPEGGDLVEELESVLAFKATRNEVPVAVSGLIKDGSGKTITTFKSAHDGMGNILLAPLSKASYYAEWKDESGQLQKTPLPAAKAVGSLLQVKQSPGYVAFVVKRSDNVATAQKKVHLVAQIQQQLVYRAVINLEKTAVTSGVISTDSLTTGIMQLTLFDQDWKPLAERIVFLNKEDYEFEANINPYAKKLGKRGKNIIEVEVPDTFKTNLSIAITDGQIAAGDETIVSRFLLSSDLRGYIHNASYYFSNTSDSVQQHLDLLMLTNGWRRYNWEALAAGRLPQITTPADNFLHIKGKIQGAAASELAMAPQLNLIIQAKDSSKRMEFATVSKTGEFTTGPLVFYDTINVFYQFNNSERLNRTATVSFGPAVLPPPSIGLDPALIAQQAATRAVTQRALFFAQKREEVLPQLNRRTKTLEEVVVQSKVKTRTEELEKKYVSGLFQSGNSRSFNLIDDPFAASAVNIFNYLQGKVAGLQINGSGTNYTVSRRGSATTLFLDEMPVQADLLAGILMSDIAFIKVIDPPFIGAAGGGAGGAIAIYTKRGGDAPKSSASKGLAKGQVIGYAALKEFYSPDYARAAPTDDIEDVRSTLYWNPYILTDKTTRRVKVEFYNNDVSTSLRVVLEGMNEAGKLTRVEKLIQ